MALSSVIILLCCGTLALTYNNYYDRYFDDTSVNNMVRDWRWWVPMNFAPVARPFKVTCSKGQLNLPETDADLVDAVAIGLIGDNTLKCRLILQKVHNWVLAKMDKKKEKREIGDLVQVTCERGNMTISSMDPGLSESTGLVFKTGGSAKCIAVFRELLTFLIGLGKAA